MSSVASRVFQILQNRADEGDDFSVYLDYSGRGMYGRKCPGIVASDVSTAIQALVEAIEEVVEPEGASVAQVFADYKFSTDSMGYETIVYFPYVEL